MINNNIFREEVFAPIPKYNPKFDKEEPKSVFADENRISEESVKMGNFNYDSFRSKLLNQKKRQEVLL